MKIGDKVRVKKTDFFNGSASDGAEGVVTTTTTCVKSRPIGVRLTRTSTVTGKKLSTDTYVFCYCEDELEVIEEKLSYKPGDRVKVVRLWDDNSFATGTLFIHDDSDYGLSVRYDDDGRFDSIGKGIAVVEVIEEAKSVAKFAVGDKVQLTASGVKIVQTEGVHQSREAVVGTTGTLLEIHEDSERRYLVCIDVSDAPTNGNGVDIGWLLPADGIEPYVEVATPSVPTASTVTRFVGAETDDLRFERQGDEVTLYSPDGEVLTSLTMTQLREVVAWLEGKGVA